MAVVVEVQSSDIPNMPSLEDVAIIRPADTGVVLTITGGDNGNQEVWLASTTNLGTAPIISEQTITAEGGTTSITITVVPGSLPESEETFIFVVTDPGGSPVTSTAFRLTMSDPDVFVVTRVLSAPLTETTVSITGLSFEPKFCRGYLAASEPNSEQTDAMQFTVFILDSSGDANTKCGSSVLADTSVTNVTNRRQHVDDDSVWNMVGAGAVRDFIGTPTLTSDGINIVFSDVDGVNAMPITLEFYGGRTCRGHVGANNQGIDTLSLSTANFRGDLAFGFFSQSNGVADTSGTGYWSFGVATGTGVGERWGQTIRLSSGADKKALNGDFFTGRIGSGTGFSESTQFTGFTDTGFTWTRTGGGTADQNAGVVYLDGLPIYQTIVTKSASAGSDTIATAPFDVSICMLFSSSTGSSVDTANASVSMGVCDQDATNASVSQGRSQADAPGHAGQHISITGTSTPIIVDASTPSSGNEGTMSGFVGGAITIDWAAASPAIDIGVLAFGSFDEPPPVTEDTEGGAFAYVM